MPDPTCRDAAPFADRSAQPALSRRRFSSALLGAAAAAGLGLPLAGCGGGKQLKSVPAQPRERSVDPSLAAAKINAYRRSRGLPPVAVDPRLNAIAAATAQTLAGRDTLKTELHTRNGLMDRLDAAGYAHVAAAENLGAGYPTLDLAITGWKGSRGHDRNLLNPGVTRMGIGLALADRGSYVSYWVLILARPMEDIA